MPRIIGEFEPSFVVVENPGAFREILAGLTMAYQTEVERLLDGGTQAHHTGDRINETEIFIPFNLSQKL